MFSLASLQLPLFALRFGWFAGLPVGLLLLAAKGLIPWVWLLNTQVKTALLVECGHAHVHLIPKHLSPLVLFN